MSYGHSPEPEIAPLIALHQVEQLGIILHVYTVKGIVQEFPKGLVAFRVLFPPGHHKLDIGADNVKLACVGEDKTLEIMPQKKLGELEHPALFPFSVRPSELRPNRKDKRQGIEELLVNQNSPAPPLPQKEHRHRHSISLVLHAAKENRLAEIGKLYKAHASIVSKVRDDGLAQYVLQRLQHPVYRFIRGNRNSIGTLWSNSRKSSATLLVTASTKSRKIHLRAI